MQKILPVGLITGLALTLSTSVLAAGSVEQRLSRLENLLGNQVLMEQMQQMEQIRQELTELRELVENQENQFSMIKQRQRNLYQDMDRRLHDLEVGAGNKSANTYVPVAPSSTTSNIAPPGTANVKNSNQPAVAVIKDDKNGKQKYSRIYKTLKEGNYQQAIIDFNQFIKDYPDSSYTDNAYFWLGQAYYLSRNNKKALTAFQKIVTDFPDGNKVKDARLKIGYTYFAMKDWASAKVALEKVIKDYPNDKVATNAKQRLQRMQRENR
jgi:tol-pal system protein YbgF